MTDYAELLKADTGQSARTIYLTDTNGFEEWLNAQPPRHRSVVTAHKFAGKAGSHVILPSGLEIVVNADGTITVITDPEEAEGDGVPFEEKMAKLMAELATLTAQGADLDKAIAANLAAIGFALPEAGSKAAAAGMHK